MATSKKSVAQAAKNEIVEQDTSVNAEVASTETVVDSKPKKNLGYKKLSQFLLPDGTIVATQKEASEFARKHLVTEALTAVTGGDKELSKWLEDNKAAIQAAYGAAEIKREISDETRAKMRDQMLARRAAGKL